MTEEWRPVVGWEGVYVISDSGTLKRLQFYQRSKNPEKTFLRPERVIRPDYKNNRDHGRVILRKGGRKERTWIHRIVALAFLGDPPEDKPLVLHWDDDPYNNHVSNLRYGDAQDNKDDAVRNGKAKRDVTHCPKGHPYSGDNLVGSADGRKRCRECEYSFDREQHFKRILEGIPEEDERHGTYAGYRAGCRCERCEEAHRTYKREYAREARRKKREENTN